MSDSLKEAKNIILQQQAELERISKSPLSTATVMLVSGDFIFLNSSGSVTRVEKPKFPIKAGDHVLIFSLTGQVIEKMEAPKLGKIAYIKTAGKETSEIDNEGATQLVYNGSVKGLKDGDRVLLGDSVILEKLEKENKQYVPEKVPNVNWDDIGGLEEAKALMIESIEGPHKNKEIFEFYGKKAPKGVLLYGPPGCGKTMLGKAAANSLAKIYKKEGVGSGFMYIKGPEILDKYVGVAEAAIRSIFERAKIHKNTHGYPAVVFIDEADSILARRGMDTASNMEHTIVPMFLAEMDGLEESSAIVILATNRQDILDPAIVRDGRIDRKIKVTRPTKESAKDIVLMNLKNAPIAKGHDKEKMATLGAAELFSKKRVLYKIATSAGVVDMHLSHIVNGGMVAGVVDYAMSLAIRRDLSSGKKSGLTCEDMFEAISHIERQSRDLNHNHEIEDFVEPFKEEVTGISRYAEAA